MSKWLGLLLALALGLMLWASGHWSSPGVPIALAILAVVGALFPPAALVLGGMAILVVVLEYGSGLASTLQKLLKGGGSQ